MGQQDVPKLTFFKTAFNAAIKDCLVEPRRAAVSLDYDYTVQQVGCVKAQHHSQSWLCPHKVYYYYARAVKRLIPITPLHYSAARPSAAAYQH